MAASGEPPAAGWGMVHGRYQPFHTGHLTCLRLAAQRCERLLVGITNPERRRVRPEPADPQRHLPAANPFSYVERLLMVEAAVRDAAVGIPVHVVPFPISEPESWDDYVPPGTVHFLRRFSAWGGAKEERLRAAGYAVVVLDEGAAKDVSGAEVRALLARGDGRWRELVPPAVAELLGG